MFVYMWCVSSRRTPVVMIHDMYTLNQIYLIIDGFNRPTRCYSSISGRLNIDFGFSGCESDSLNNTYSRHCNLAKILNVDSKSPHTIAVCSKVENTVLASKEKITGNYALFLSLGRFFLSKTFRNIEKFQPVQTGPNLVAFRL